MLKSSMEDTLQSAPMRSYSLKNSNAWIDMILPILSATGGSLGALSFRFIPTHIIEMILKVCLQVRGGLLKARKRSSHGRHGRRRLRCTILILSRVVVIYVSNGKPLGMAL